MAIVFNADHGKKIDNLNVGLAQTNSQLADIVNFFKVKGYELDASKLDTIEKVNANWNILKTIIRNNNLPLSFKNKITLNSIFAEWISGRDCPIGFYSDSTTDGATTTGHISSVGNDSPFKVTINNSPNAYPTLLKNYVKTLYPNANVSCYNGGFDSMSYANGFGLKQWYNTWFRGSNGSNVDWSDVKMIVLGFGTSDSINLNNTATVIDNYSIDLECNIVDCLLRGIQPVLQAPVLTTQRVGNTVSYRNSDESITIIEACQKRLCKKYDLEYLSLREPFEIALNNFSGYKFNHFISADMVHPNDLGHRVIASWIFNKLDSNIINIESEDNVKALFSGHQSYVTIDSENFAPSSKGGNILKSIPTGYISEDSYYYNWSVSDGNTKVYNDKLLQIPIFIKKPTAIFYNNLESRRTYNKQKSISIFSTLFNQNSALKVDSEMLFQPEEYYSNKTFLGLLPYGLNIITVYANDNVTEQKLGAFFFADIEKHLSIYSVGRGSSGANYLTKNFNFPNINSTYTKKNIVKKERLNKYYNPTDNTPVEITFRLLSSLVAGATYQIYSHYNDIKTYQDGYNLIEILGDVVTFKVATSTGVATLSTQTITGLNALLVSGARIRITYTSKDYNSTGVILNIFVNEVIKFGYTGTQGQIWSEGYGFDAPNLLCENISIIAQNKLGGFDTEFLF